MGERCACIVPDGMLFGSSSSTLFDNGMMKDLSVLQKLPFTDRGSIVEVFTDLTLKASSIRSMPTRRREERRDGETWKEIL